MLRTFQMPLVYRLLMDSRALSEEAVFEEDMSDRPHPQEMINSCKFKING